MTLQTDPERPLVPESGSLRPSEGPDAGDPEVVVEAALGILEEDGVHAATGFMRTLLPADQGIVLKRTSRRERRQLLAMLTLDELSDILDETPTESAATITRELRPAEAADALDEIDTHTVADILQELSPEQADAIVAELDRPQDVVPLLQYPADSAGGMMTPDFPHVRYDDTAANALDALRLFGEDAEGFGWACVLSNDRQLLEYVSIAQLALARPHRVVGELADEYVHRLVSVSPDIDQEEAHRLMSRYTLSILPVVAGPGGIAGTQTLTLVVRGLAVEEVPTRSGLALLGRELMLGLAHGLMLAVLVGALGYLWKGSIGLAAALAIAIVGNLLVAALAGAGVPLALRRLGVDPAVSSSVFATTFTDVFGFLIFLGTASLLISWLG